MFGRALAVVAVAALACAPKADAAVGLVADAPFPDFPDLITVDPYLGTSASRGITADRNLRQTFKLAEEIDVAEIVLSFDVNAPEGGMIIDFYNVDDVDAETWDSGLTPIHTITIPTLVATTERLGITLTDSDVFTLPARFAGTTGYGVELSNADNTTTIGTWRHTLTGVDEYTDGVFYTEGGGQSGSTPTDRDVGISLVDVGAMPAVPGDVDGDGDVDAFEADMDMISDLDIIAANFRQPGNRASGDLTGDAFVDLADFRAWKANFPGAFSPSMFPGFGVPEPASAASLLFAMTLGMARRGSRRNDS